MDFFKRYLLMFFYCLFFFACNSIKILNAEKQKVLPGVSTSEAYFLYQLKVKIKNQTVFKHMILNDTLTVKNFSVIAVDSNLQLNKNSVFEKGLYLLQFNLPKSKVDEFSDDIIFIEFTQNNNAKSIQTVTKKGTIINLK